MPRYANAGVVAVSAPCRNETVDRGAGEYLRDARDTKQRVGLGDRIVRLRPRVAAVAAQGALARDGHAHGADVVRLHEPRDHSIELDRAREPGPGDGEASVRLLTGPQRAARPTRSGSPGSSSQGWDVASGGVFRQVPAEATRSVFASCASSACSLERIGSHLSPTCHLLT